MPRIGHLFKSDVVAHEFKIRQYAAHTESIRNYQNLFRKSERILKAVGVNIFFIKKNLFLNGKGLRLCNRLACLRIVIAICKNGNKCLVPYMVKNIIAKLIIISF